MQWQQKGILRNAGHAGQADCGSQLFMRVICLLLINITLTALSLLRLLRLRRRRRRARLAPERRRQALQRLPQRALAHHAPLQERAVPPVCGSGAQQAWQQCMRVACSAITLGRHAAAARLPRMHHWHAWQVTTSALCWCQQRAHPSACRHPAAPGPAPHSWAAPAAAPAAARTLPPSPARRPLRGREQRAAGGGRRQGWGAVAAAAVRSGGVSCRNGQCQAYQASCHAACSAGSTAGSCRAPINQVQETCPPAYAESSSGVCLKGSVAFQEGRSTAASSGRSRGTTNPGGAQRGGRGASHVAGQRAAGAWRRGGAAGRQDPGNRRREKNDVSLLRYTNHKQSAHRRCRGSCRAGGSRPAGSCWKSPAGLAAQRRSGSWCGMLQSAAAALWSPTHSADGNTSASQRHVQ